MKDVNVFSHIYVQWCVMLHKPRKRKRRTILIKPSGIGKLLLGSSYFALGKESTEWISFNKRINCSPMLPLPWRCWGGGVVITNQQIKVRMPAEKFILRGRRGKISWIHWKHKTQHPVANYFWIKYRCNRHKQRISLWSFEYFVVLPISSRSEQLIMS